jgi:hypothetical protein
MQRHKIPIGMCIQPPSLDDTPLSGIPWHNLTQTEIIFVSAYFNAKSRMISNQFIRVAVVVLIVEMVLTWFTFPKHVLFVTSVVLLVAFVIFKTYTHTWVNVDNSAECTYYPISARFSLKHNNYVSIVVDGKTYTYLLDGEPHSQYVMVANYRGLSCAINSKSLPCDTQRKDLV